MPRMGVEPFQFKVPAAQDMALQIEQTLEQTRHNLKKTQEAMKTQADKHRSDVREYKIGDLVWLSTANLNLGRQSRKLSEKWLGPYKIISLKGSNAVELKLPSSMRIHPVVNVSRIKPYKERLPGQRIDKPGAVTVTEDGDPEYLVDYIVDSCLKRGRLEYLIHWEGYPEEERTWEPEGNLEHAPEKVRDFYRRKHNAPRKLRMIRELFDTLFKPYENLTDAKPLFDHLEVDP